MLKIDIWLMADVLRFYKKMMIPEIGEEVKLRKQFSKNSMHNIQL
jgi:hypothetical protein